MDKVLQALSNIVDELREIHAEGGHAGDHTIDCPDCREDGYTSNDQHCPTCSCQLVTG